MSVIYASSLRTNRLNLVVNALGTATSPTISTTGTAAGTLVIGTSALAATAFAVTFTNGSANISGTGLPTTVDTPVVFATTGSLPTNFTAGTTYYVRSGSTSTTITVAASPGGAAITAGSAGTGTHTAVFGALATFTLPTTPASVSGDTLTFAAITNATASATGAAAKAELRNNAGTVIVSGLTVGTSLTDVIISNTAITTGQTVSISSASISHPNT